MGNSFCDHAVKLVIVHYHLRPGGIRRVIELATPFLLQRLGNVTTVEVVCGEAADEKWNQNFAQLVAPAKLQLTIEPAIGYYSEQTGKVTKTTHSIATTLNKTLADANPNNCLVWAHNLGIGRNLLLTRELTRACAARSITLISHHHDWWFDNRWLRWPEIRRSGFPTLASVAKIIFPETPTVRHAAINHQEAAILKRHLPKTATWLPNLATRNETPKPDRVRFAQRWLQKKLNHHSAPVWILPCRLLRRKNIAEALLLTRWLRPEAWLVTTGGASSEDELAYFEKLQQAAQQHHWRLRLGVLQSNEKEKPAVAELLAASEAVLLTSIQEGFGLPYLEAAAAGRPLVARNLPNVAPDLHQFGFRFPQAYDEILVRPELFDWKAERARQQIQFARWQRNLPPALRRISGKPALLATKRAPSAVAFSRLTLTAQLEVLAQPVTRSWELCAPLNPFLQTWSRRASNQRLQITRWPRSAERWLSGDTYARRLVELANSPLPEAKNFGATRIQEDFFGKKLCPANLYPLLWAAET